MHLANLVDGEASASLGLRAFWETSYGRLVCNILLSRELSSSACADGGQLLGSVRLHHLCNQGELHSFFIHLA